MTSSTGSTQLFSQKFIYDRYGNRTIDPTSWGPINLKQFTVDTATNRLGVPGGQSGTMSYDVAGNLTTDSYTGAGARTYDGENRMITAAGTNGSNTYVYDGNGRRVRRVVGATETWLVYGIGGELVAEYPVNGTATMPQKEYGYRSGEMLVVGGCDVARWLVTDHLGTPRIEVEVGGGLAQVKRHDYLPFGEEMFATGSVRTTGRGYATQPGQDCVRQEFDGYERDNETGLDYAQARYFSNTQGRFTSVDPYNIVMETQYNPNERKAKSHFLAYLSNPQRWNRYSFTLNNPLLYTDPDGEDVTIYYRPPGEGGSSDGDFGHILIYVRNDKTGESAYFDYYPDNDEYPGNGYTVINGVNQARIDGHASITIETTADQEQAILDGIKALQGKLPNYDASPSNILLGCESTCASRSRDLLKLGGIELNGQSPAGLWNEAYRSYSKEGLDWKPSYVDPKTGGPFFDPKGPGFGNPQVGQDYGRDPRGQAHRWDPAALNSHRRTFYKDGKAVNPHKK